MATKRQLLADIELVNTLKFITQAYQEISVMRMKKMRVWVLASRQYLTELSKVFYDVRNSYKHQFEQAVAKKQKNKFGLTSTKGKELNVFISANSKLYGDIIDRVFDKFVEGVKKSNADILIVGKLGKILFEQAKLKKQYLYFEIPETIVTVMDLRPIIFHLVKYNKINVYYGQFENVVTQNPSVSNITGDQSFTMGDTDKKNNQKDVNVRFLFEPSIEKILEFFQTQVFSALFKQTVHEAHLAHFASRIRAMEEALNNIEGVRTKLYSDKKRMRHSIENKKVLETVAGMRLWSRGT